VRPPFVGQAAQGTPRPAAAPLRPAAGAAQPHLAAAPVIGSHLLSRPYFPQPTGLIQGEAVMPQGPMMPQPPVMPPMQPQVAVRKHKSKKKKTVQPTTVQGGPVLAAGARSLGQPSLQSQGYVSQGSLAPMQGHHHMYQFPYIPSGYEQHGQFPSQFQQVPVQTQLG
jgi:hypothetical protein